MLSNINDEWDYFLKYGTDVPTRDDDTASVCTEMTDDIASVDENVGQDADNFTLNISTTTKILYLNQPIDIYAIFWDIPVIQYWMPIEGTVKKQIKIISKTPEEHREYCKKLSEIGHYYDEIIIRQINNENARSIKFKNETKVTVGMSKKDITTNGKKKLAFYNCISNIFRLNIDGMFQEIHVKIFNTGKIEIPGITNSNTLLLVRQKILNLLVIYMPDIAFTDYYSTILINSNFNCGYFLDRTKLYYILRKTYGIEAVMDSCNYPGIKCKFYFNNAIGFNPDLQNGLVLQDDFTKLKELKLNKNYIQISFMIFRTGSCLIIGKCSEQIIEFVFEFLKNILIAEKPLISIPTTTDPSKPSLKKIKINRKTIKITADV